MLWDAYMAVMTIVRKTHPSEDDINGIGAKIERFVGFYVDNYEGSQSQYLHILRDHIEDKMRYCYTRCAIVCVGG